MDAAEDHQGTPSRSFLLYGGLACFLMIAVSQIFDLSDFTLGRVATIIICGALSGLLIAALRSFRFIDGVRLALHMLLIGLIVATLVSIRE